jgi:tetratricopeptide (TPR) repeat protein
VERATLRALERTPADRFPSIEAFLTVLRDPKARDPATASHVRRAGLIGVVALLVAVAGTVAWLSSRDEGANAQTVEPQVIALYQRGMRAYDRRTPAGVIEAIGSLRGAVARDSAYAPAWNALAKAYVRAHQRVFRVPGVPPERLVSLAVEAVNRSLSLDSMSADAWMTQSIVSEQVDPVDLSPALRAIRRSIVLDSAQPAAWHDLARIVAHSGDLDQALKAWRRSVRLNPAYTEGVTFLALGHYWRENFDSAAVWADSAVRLDASYLLARMTLGLIAIERGDFVRAEGAFESARRLSSDVELVNSLAGFALVKARSGHEAEAKVILQRAESLAASYDPLPLHTAVNIAQVYAALGETERSVGVLRRYSPARDQHFQFHLRCDPPFAPLIRDQHFRALLVRPRLAPGMAC